MLIAKQHVGTRKTYRLTLSDDSKDEHPIAGTPEWKIIEHLGSDGSKSVRPLAKVSPSTDGHTAEVHAFAWPGIVEIEIVAHAPHPMPADPSVMPRSTRYTKRLVIPIAEVPALSKSLELRVAPEGYAAQ